MMLRSASALLSRLKSWRGFFPLASMAAVVRWFGYALPLTWFVVAARGIFLKGTGPGALLLPFGILVLMAVIVFGLAMFRFRQDLAPKQAKATPLATPATQPAARP